MTIQEFAKKKGFPKVKYAGVYKGAKVYKPLKAEEQDIGLPFFILVTNGKAKLVTGEQGLDILDALYN